jgi:hypothetical protein
MTQTPKVIYPTFGVSVIKKVDYSPAALAHT